MLMNKKDFALYLGFILIVASAFFLRLYQLDLRVFHHDEAAVGYFAYKLFNDGIYSYNPAFHGPFMYYATAGVFRLLGDSIYSARLLPALLGASMLFLLIPLRRYTGERGMVLAAFFLAFSPSFLYYSRFYREDIFISFFTLLALVCAVKYAESYAENNLVMRGFYLFVAGLSLASMAALKENAYISIALIVFFLFLFFIREKWYKGLTEKLRGHDRRALIIVAEGFFLIMVFLIAFSLFYTGKILDLSGIWTAVEKAFSHWYEMHSIKRIGGPMYFYLPILGLYELPALIFGFAGIAYYYKRNNLLMTFLVYWAMINLIVYSYLQEKVPWLVLNPLLPLTIIAAAYLGELMPRLKLNSRNGAAAVILISLILFYFVHSSVLLNYYNYTSPAEPLIQAAQPPQRFSELLGKISEVSSRYKNQSTEIQVTDDQMETQFLWYLRHYDNVKWRVKLDSELNAPLIVVHDTDGNESDADIVQRRLRSDYERLDSAKMSWYWFKPADFTLDYLLYRKMDGQPGEYRVVLFYKPGS